MSVSEIIPATESLLPLILVCPLDFGAFLQARCPPWWDCAMQLQSLGSGFTMCSGFDDGLGLKGVGLDDGFAVDGLRLDDDLVIDRLGLDGGLVVDLLRVIGGGRHFVEGRASSIDGRYRAACVELPVEGQKNDVYHPRLLAASHVDIWLDSRYRGHGSLLMLLPLVRGAGKQRLEEGAGGGGVDEAGAGGQDRVVNLSVAVAHKRSAAGRVVEGGRL